jgi:hypothetical protein
MAASLNTAHFRKKSAYFSLTLAPGERKKISNILGIAA